MSSTWTVLSRVVRAALELARMASDLSVRAHVRCFFGRDDVRPIPLRETVLDLGRQTCVSVRTLGRFARFFSVFDSRLASACCARLRVGSAPSSPSACGPFVRVVDTAFRGRLEGIILKTEALPKTNESTDLDRVCQAIVRFRRAVVADVNGADATALFSRFSASLNPDFPAFLNGAQPNTASDRECRICPVSAVDLVWLSRALLVSSSSRPNSDLALAAVGRPAAASFIHVACLDDCSSATIALTEPDVRLPRKGTDDLLRELSELSGLSDGSKLD